VGKTLIVDDEEDMRVLMRELINAANEGLRVVGEAGSGADAIDLRAAVAPHVVVLDYQMPGLDGIDTAERLLQDQPELPIVLYSAYLDRELTERARAVGVRHCVKKGDSKGLVRVLRQLCAN